MENKNPERDETIPQSCGPIGHWIGTLTEDHPVFYDSDSGDMSVTFVALSLQWNRKQKG